ncbi:MAG: YCF48-related protein [Bacteroidia bacterium]
MKKFTFKTTAAFVMITTSILFFRCSKNNNSTSTPTVTAPTVTTTTITFSPTAPFVAMSGGSITSAGNGTVTAYGICYSSTNQNPDLTSTFTTDGHGATGATNYVSYLNGLTPGTTYYVRAYATNSAGTAYGNLVQFTTGTASWTSVVFTGTTTIKALSGINFSDDNHGFAFGINTNNQVMFMSSSDGGATWTTPSVAVTQGNLSVTNNGGNLPVKNKSISFTSNSTGWITYGGDSVLTTLNGGASWALYPYPNNTLVPGEGLNSTCFTGSNTGFVAGLGIYKTTTGNSWTNVVPNSTYFNSIYFINASVGFAGSANSIVRTTDGGNTWQAFTTSAPVYGFSYANGVLFAAGSQSLLVSTDNGTTWGNKVAPATMYNVCFMSQSFGVVATSGGLYQTVDGGNTWTSINTSGAFNDVCHTSNHIFAISGTTILRL